MKFLPLILGYVLDLIIGDPYSLPHPIRAIGTLITRSETILRRQFKNELLGGTVLTIVVVGVSTVVPWALLTLAYKVSTVLGVVLESIMCYQMLATKCLKVESMKVYYSLQRGDLPQARKDVSMIVGRDTKNLTVEGVTKATVETIAENTSDGIIAPMLYMALFGAVGGFFYKAINTLDSMVGYKNDKYLYFGRTSARLDDVLNYVPSRLSALMVVLASAVLKLDYKSAFKIWCRDSRKHPSPNSAQTESAYAGALNVQLAGDMYYFGKLHRKPTIGDSIRPIRIDDIKTANRLLYMTSLVGLVLSIVVRVAIAI